MGGSPRTRRGDNKTRLLFSVDPWPAVGAMAQDREAQPHGMQDSLWGQNLLEVVRGGGGVSTKQGPMAAAAAQGRAAGWQRWQRQSWEGLDGGKSPVPLRCAKPRTARWKRQGGRYTGSQGGELIQAPESAELAVTTRAWSGAGAAPLSIQKAPRGATTQPAGPWGRGRWPGPVRATPAPMALIASPLKVQGSRAHNMR